MLLTIKSNTMRFSTCSYIHKYVHIRYHKDAIKSNNIKRYVTSKKPWHEHVELSQCDVIMNSVVDDVVPTFTFDCVICFIGCSIVLFQIWRQASVWTGTGSVQRMVGCICLRVTHVSTVDVRTDELGSALQSSVQDRVVKTTSLHVTSAVITRALVTFHHRQTHCKVYLLAYT